MCNIRMNTKWLPAHYNINVKKIYILVKYKCNIHVCMKQGRARVLLYVPTCANVVWNTSVQCKYTDEVKPCQTV